MIESVTGVEVSRELYRRSFREFVADAFEVLEGGDAWLGLVLDGLRDPKMQPGWHVDAICDHLQAVTDGQFDRLLINVPPGTSKSILTCVMWPAWIWARGLNHRMLFSSYSESFTRRDTRRCKQLMRSEWYRRHFPEARILATPDTAMEFHVSNGGERHGSSTNSGVTGKHVHGIVEDDPLKQQDSYSERKRDEAWRYHTETLSTRLLPDGYRVLVMQRLHVDDPAGRILASQDGDESAPERWVHLRLPMRYETSSVCLTPLGRPDPRTEEGELLWPARFGEKHVTRLAYRLGDYGNAGQLQQRPTPEGGAIIKEDQIAYYDDLPDTARVAAIVWDLTFKGSGTSFVVGQAWALEDTGGGQMAARFYLVDQVRFRAGYAETRDIVRRFWARWSRVPRGYDPQRQLQMYDTPRIVSVEEAANGHAILSDLADVIPALTPYPATASKVERLHVQAPLFQAHQVLAPRGAPWVAEWVKEITTFPFAANDDQVDATTQALDQLRHLVAESSKSHGPIVIGPPRSDERI